MPLVRVSIRHGRSPEDRFAIGAAVQQAMIESLAVPPLDCFLVITEYGAAGLVYDPTHLGVDRTDDLILVQITLTTGRSLAQKRAFYHRVAALLGEEPGVRREDVLINLIEVPPENWSFVKEDAPDTMP